MRFRRRCHRQGSLCLQYASDVKKDEQIFNTINRVDKAITEHGFAARRRMTKPEIKRMLALYFGTSISGEEISDVEGSENFELGVSENV